MRHFDSLVQLKIFRPFSNEADFWGGGGGGGNITGAFSLFHREVAKRDARHHCHHPLPVEGC